MSLLATLQGCELRKWNGARCSGPVKGAKRRISMKKLRFLSCLGAKVKGQGPLGPAGVQPCFFKCSLVSLICHKILTSVSYLLRTKDTQ